MPEKKPPTPPGKAKGKTPAGNDAKRPPTPLDAPSDFTHIFNGANGTAISVATPQQTALIAPSDFTHMYHGENALLQMPNKTANDAICNVASTTPTVMIAPSDFQHIYRDQDAIKAADSGPVRKVTIAADRPSPSPKAMPKVAKLPTTPKAWGPPEEEEPRQSEFNNTPTSDVEREAEVLPNEILLAVKRFIERQKKTYTINTAKKP